METRTFEYYIKEIDSRIRQGIMEAKFFEEIWMDCQDILDENKVYNWDLPELKEQAYRVYLKYLQLAPQEMVKKMNDRPANSVWEEDLEVETVQQSPEIPDDQAHNYPWIN